MRTILAQALKISAADLQIQTHKEGKPYIPQNPLYFNLSHSEELAMLALSFQGEVGIDIEYLNPDIDTINIPKRFFHPLECEQLEQMPPEKRQHYFYYCWTGKEAYLKAKGVGIANHLQQFSLNFQNPDSIKIVFTTKELEEFKNWTVYTFQPNNNYLSTVVSSTASNILQFHNFSFA
jgi:4'-phosphopantetheinyl transferase